MVRARVIAATAAICSLSVAHAADGPTSKATIDQTSATVRTFGAKIPPKEFGDRWLKAMTSSGVFQNVTLTESKQTSTSESSGATIVVTRRYAFAELRFVERVSPVLFELTETRKSCDPSKSALWDEDYGCDNEIELALTGPIASYEQATPYESLEQLFGGKQKITWTYYPADKKITTVFQIKSLQFERSVIRMLESRFGRMLAAADVDISQNFILLATSRVLRDINEGVLR